MGELVLRFAKFLLKEEMEGKEKEVFFLARNKNASVCT